MSEDVENSNYGASQIQVLEGLEPVRLRPGMYIGGTDKNAMHHMVNEIIDNSMDEAVAGYANRIDFIVNSDISITVKDNGRGIPVEEHPKFPGKTALEVIFTTLHSGGKFDTNVYATSGGLHGVGSAVVNALSSSLVVEVARNKKLYRQEFSKGDPLTNTKIIGDVHNRRGTSVTFTPDSEIFGKARKFSVKRLYELVKSKAYLFKGIEIRWNCEDKLAKANEIKNEEVFYFANGVSDFLQKEIGKRKVVTPRFFAGNYENKENHEKFSWAIAWTYDEEGFSKSYCNTIPTPQGGTHENGFRLSIYRAVKAYAERIKNKKAENLTADDLLGDSSFIISCFIREPQFQGQTKDKLSSPSAQKMVEGQIKDLFEEWLMQDPQSANELLDYAIRRLDDRTKRRAAKQKRKSATSRRLRLPGKLADCSSNSSYNTELFLVEGDSAGGSAKQGRDRKNQAILPLKGKILNVASANNDKISANQEIKDIVQALGCGMGSSFDLGKLRYERVIIMTDADVDGSHIATLLMTFFYKEMYSLISSGALYLAMPPLYKISNKNKSVYAMDDDDKDKILKNEFAKNAKVDISRFKGLGEMSPNQLKLTTMNPKTRSLIKVDIPNRKNENELDKVKETADIVNVLMGKSPELRFDFIQEKAKFVTDVNV